MAGQIWETPLRVLSRGRSLTLRRTLGVVRPTGNEPVYVSIHGGEERPPKSGAQNACSKTPFPGMNESLLQYVVVGTFGLLRLFLGPDAGLRMTICVPSIWSHFSQIDTSRVLL